MPAIYAIIGDLHQRITVKGSKLIQKILCYKMTVGIDLFHKHAVSMYSL